MPPLLIFSFGLFIGILTGLIIAAVLGARHYREWEKGRKHANL